MELWVWDLWGTSTLALPGSAPAAPRQRPGTAPAIPGSAEAAPWQHPGNPRQHPGGAPAAPWQRPGSTGVVNYGKFCPRASGPLGGKI